MMQKSASLPDEQSMEAFGAELARTLPEGVVVYLEGELGAGKTTSIRGLIRALGYSQSVKSPTYSLVESYAFGARKIHHFDLYRLADPEELAYMGIDEYFDGKTSCFIEWAQKGENYLPPSDLKIYYAHQGKGRRVQLVSETPLGEVWLKRLHLVNEE